MTRNLLVLIMTLFQDNYVRLGALTGALAGFWNPEFLHGEAGTNAFVYGFIGWGIGAYLANYKAENTQFDPKKEIPGFSGRPLTQALPFLANDTVSGHFSSASKMLKPGQIIFFSAQSYQLFRHLWPEFKTVL